MKLFAFLLMLLGYYKNANKNHALKLTTQGAPMPLEWAQKRSCVTSHGFLHFELASLPEKPFQFLAPASGGL